MTSEVQAFPRRRNPRGQGQVLRAELVAAAAQLLASLDRPETLTLRQVAREVGVAPASIYGHFPDLDGLIQHVMRLRYDELASLMNAAAGEADGPLDDLASRCAAYVRWGVAQPGHYRTLFGGRLAADVVDGPADGAGQDLLGSVVSSLAAVTGTAEDEARWRAGLLLWTSLHGLVSLHNDHGDLSWPPLQDAVADLLAMHTGRPVRETAAYVPALDDGS